MPNHKLSIFWDVGLIHIFLFSEIKFDLNDEGNHGNEADVNCECTILIKDHDTATPDFASFPTKRNNVVSKFPYSYDVIVHKID